MEDMQIVKRFIPRHTAPVISCHICGKPVEAQGLTMCNDCIALQVDITAGLQKSGEFTFCKNCGRVQVPPHQWVYAERESRELMAILLKRLKTQDHNTRFVDARYLWTEPHSRRTKLRITVQGEADKFDNAVIQQTYDVEFVERTNMCRDCAKSYTVNTWVASIQLRQRVDHKKTFLWLEQLMLVTNAHKDTLSIAESRDGIDFFFGRTQDSEKMLAWLAQNVPIRSKKSGQLISEDIQNSAKSMKFTVSVEIAPICREDLVVLPKSLARSHGQMPLLCLCYKINNSVHLIDPNTLRTTQINSAEYWKRPFKSVANSRSFTEFVVLDIEPTGPVKDRFVLADATVSPSNDFDVQYLVRTHLGGVLHPGDTVVGYDLTNANFNDENWDQLKAEEIPECILVKKTYPDKPRKKRQLNRMAKEYIDDEETQAARAAGQRVPGFTNDYDEFLEELNEDPDLIEELDKLAIEDK